MIAMLLTATILAADIDGIALPAAAPWKVESANGICRASRLFGADASTSLRITAVPLTGNYILAITLPHPIKIHYNDNITLSIGSTGQIINSNAFGFDPAGDMQTTVALRVPRNVFTAAASPIAFAVGGKPFVSVAIGEPTAMLAMLASCETALLKDLGVDASANAAVVTPPEWIDGPEVWFRTSDYPPEAQRAGAEGRVGTRFRVVADGSVTECAIASSSGNVALDEKTCLILTTRGRYRPALDGTGRPIASMQVLFTSWHLPR